MAKYGEDTFGTDKYAEGTVSAEPEAGKITVDASVATDKPVTIERRTV